MNVLFIVYFCNILFHIKMADNGQNSIKSLAEAEKNINTLAVRIVTSVMFDLNATIADRVQNEGKDSDGGTFGNYSRATQAYKRAKRHTTRPYPLINFTDTGEMWNSVKPDIKENNNKIVVTLGATGSYNEYKMDENVNRFGKTIVQPSKDELNQALADATTRIFKELKKILE